MIWFLELHSKDGWVLWTNGDLEQCLADLFAWKNGAYGKLYDAVRLTCEKTE